MPRPRLGRETKLAGRGPRVASAGEKGKPEPAGMLLDEPQVPVRLASAPAVVDMADGEMPPGFGRNLGRSVKQRHRVSSAGDGEEEG